MKFYNTIDDQGRFAGLKAYCIGDGQYDTHSISYLYERSIYQGLGETMGLDRLVGGEEIPEYRRQAIVKSP